MRLVGYERPNSRETILLAFAAAAVLGLLLARLRQAIMMGQGDAQVFFRAGWAVWTGYPLYQVVDDHGWSYHYPPPFALLMGPFANPLPGFSKPAWAAPYPLSLALWYALGVGALIGAMQILANAIARFSGAWLRPGMDNPYWALRLLPPLALIVFVAAGWARGQPTTILVLLIVMFLVFLSERRPFAASIALSIAITIKIFPAAFLLIPILRRDVRTIACTALSTAVLLIAIPLVCLGPDTTIGLYHALWTERLQGLATGQVNPRIASEISPWGINMVSVGSMLARTFATPMPAAPYRLPDWAKYSQYAVDLLIMLAIAAVGYRRFWRLEGPQPNAPYAILIAGAILLAALPAMLPVATPHYWAQEIPLVAILFVEGWRRSGSVRPSVAQIVWTAATVFAFAAGGPDAPGVLSRLGPTTIVMLAPIVAGLIALRRLSDVDAAAPTTRPATEN